MCVAFLFAFLVMLFSDKYGKIDAERIYVLKILDVILKVRKQKCHLMLIKWILHETTTSSPDCFGTHN